MADGYFGDWAVTLPDNTKADQARTSNVDMFMRSRERQLERQYRAQKDSEMDEWRRLNLIQGLTDLSKYQTGSDVANAIGHKQAASVLQKYTAVAKAMSPSELQAKISQEMSSTISGMNAAKNELELADEQLKTMKQQFPELDIPTLAKDYRTEILSRRLKGEQFANPLEVPQSQFNVTDPEFLSRYVKGNKALTEMFQNPKGLDETSVFMGSPTQYTQYKAKIPAWKRPSFDPSQLKGGFLTSRTEPSLEFKKDILPSEALPSSNGKPFEMIDKGFYDTIEGSAKMELIKETRSAFPGYDNFSQTEKEYAQRNTLLKLGETLDRTDFHPTEVRRAPITSNKTTINMPAGPKTVNDVFGEIEANLQDDTTAITENGKRIGTRFNALSAEAQDVIFDYFGGKKEGFDESTIFIGKQRDNGGVPIYKVDDSGQPNPTQQYQVGVLTKKGTNFKVQPGVPEKRIVVAQGNKPKTEKTFNVINPKTGKVVLSGVTEEEANKAKAKGYKIQ